MNDPPEAGFVALVALVAFPTVMLAFVPLTPLILPPVIATLLAFWLDMVPNEPVALVTAVAT